MWTTKYWGCYKVSISKKGIISKTLAASVATDGQVKSVKFLTERMGEMMALNVQLRQELKNRHPELTRKDNENVYSQEEEWI